MWRRNRHRGKPGGDFREIFMQGTFERMERGRSRKVAAAIRQARAEANPRS
jgi:hypothetical protein